MLSATPGLLQVPRSDKHCLPHTAGTKLGPLQCPRSLNPALIPSWVPPGAALLQAQQHSLAQPGTCGPSSPRTVPGTRRSRHMRTPGLSMFPREITHTESAQSSSSHLSLPCSHCQGRFWAGPAAEAPHRAAHRRAAAPTASRKRFWAVPRHVCLH